MGGPATIDGETYREFDNFFKCSFIFRGFVWSSSEQAFQAVKFDSLRNPEWVERKNATIINEIIDCDDPQKSWAVGQSREYKLRDDWEEMKVQEMFNVCYAKVTQNWDMALKLCKTRGKIVFTESTKFWNKYNGEIYERIRELLLHDIKDVIDVKLSSS